MINQADEIHQMMENAQTIGDAIIANNRRMEFNRCHHRDNSESVLMCPVCSKLRKSRAEMMKRIKRELRV